VYLRIYIHHKHILMPLKITTCISSYFLAVIATCTCMYNHKYIKFVNQICQNKIQWRPTKLNVIKEVAIYWFMQVSEHLQSIDRGKF